MLLTVVDYGVGNLRSIAKSLEKANSENGLKYSIKVTSDIKDIRKSDKLVLPGQGSFKACKGGIDKIIGLDSELNEGVKNKKKPIFGICAGMQLFATTGYEDNETKGLNWIPGDVVKLDRKESELKIPHMGWNEVNAIESPLFKGISNNSDFYFVHSYHFKTAKENIVASTIYSSEITAAVQKDNIFGTQFHPEKSHNNGQLLIKNFIDW